jgi:hypothetical protein
MGSSPVRVGSLHPPRGARGVLVVVCQCSCFMFLVCFFIFVHRALGLFTFEGFVFGFQGSIRFAGNDISHVGL